MSAKQAVDGLRSSDPDVRLDAATSLRRAVDASTIPSLIGALMDPAEAVRGQACEALADITGETFDFVDIGPESMRAESVAMWRAWWRQNKDAILSGADPRKLAAEPVDLAAPARPSSGRTRRPRRRTSRTLPVRRTPAPASAPAVEPELPSLDDEIAAAIDQVVSADEAARAAPRRTPAPTSRRGRMRDAKAAAMGQANLKSVMPSPEELAAMGPTAPAQEEPESPEDMLQDLVSGIEIDPDDLPDPDEELPPID